MAYYESFLKSALNEYQHPNVTETEILELFTTFTDLRPRVSTFCFNDGTEKDLLNLEGTIPVKYKGQIYNIPVVIWLLRDFPDIPPTVYVNPTASMQIKAGRNVHIDGKIDLPYLREWKCPGSDLTNLVQILTIIFGEEPPVYHKQERKETTAQEPSDQATIQNTNIREVDRQRVRMGFNISSDDEEALLTSIVRLKYEHPELVIADVISVLSEFVDLEYSNDFFVYDDGYKKRLFKLTGTIPVKFKGTVSNVPVSIWLSKRHPHKAPMAYVVPSSRMHVMSGNFVDMNGKVHIPYLADWRHPEMCLLSLVQVMTTAFAEELPVQLKLTTGDMTSRPGSGGSVPGQRSSAATSFEVSGRRQ